MKESVLDVLMYLFEHYVDDDTDLDVERDTLSSRLVHAGFPEAEITKAFSWLDGLTLDETATSESAPRASTSVRVYSDEEMLRLDVACRGFLLFLEQAAVLDTRTRELVIDRLMALETHAIDLDQLKWVVLMVLFNQPGKESVCAWMEDLVFESAGERLH